MSKPYKNLSKEAKENVKKRQLAWYHTKGKFMISLKYSDYKNGAKGRNIFFDLTLDEFRKFWGKNCFYCGSKIETIGLDRIKNDIGYVIENLISCCWKCNC